MQSDFSNISFFKKSSDSKSGKEKWFDSLKIANMVLSELKDKNQAQVQASLGFGTFNVQDSLWLNPTEIDGNISQTNHVIGNQENLEIPEQKSQTSQNDPSTNRGRQKRKNETKNIPKNFGKAIISFIVKSKKLFIPQLAFSETQYDKMIVELKKLKKVINTIADLRNLWLNNKYSREIRIMSNYFLRRHGAAYVFNSRITSRDIHLKHRNRLIDAIKAPAKFIHIKEY